MKAIGETDWFPADRRKPHSRHDRKPPRLVHQPPTRMGRADCVVREQNHRRSFEKTKPCSTALSAAFEAEGADAWYSRKPEGISSAINIRPKITMQVFDIVDVWFESGSTHAFCLDQDEGVSEWPNLRWPADLYLEGSDQHRGWFHSSLLESCGTLGRAPFGQVLTHGFILDEQGRKMSKSLGNVTAPQEVIDQMGADILRLWVVASDFSDDLRIGKEILKQIGDPIAVSATRCVICSAHLERV